jgi:hypothetical protein
MERDLTWKVVAFASGAVAAAAVRRVAVMAWRSGRHEDPPVHPGSGGVRTREALVWAVSVAAGVAVARVVAERAAAAVWSAATGSSPPALDD